MVAMVAAQLVSLGPVDSIVMADFPCLALPAEPGFFTPRRIVLDSIRRICHHQLRPVLPEQSADIAGAGRITAEDPMLAADPEILRSAHRDPVGRGNQRITVRVAELEQKLIDLGSVESGER